MELSDIAIVVNLTSTVLAVLLSGAAFIISLKNRRTGLREKIFDEQISVFKELSCKMTYSENLIRDYKFEVDTLDDLDNLDDLDELGELEELQDLDELGEINELEGLEELEEELRDSLDDLDIYYSSMEIFIPDNISEEFDDYLEYIHDEIVQKINENEIGQIDLARLSRKTFEIQALMRDFIGMEKLSKENTSLYNFRKPRNNVNHG